MNKIKKVSRLVQTVVGLVLLQVLRGDLLQFPTHSLPGNVRVHVVRRVLHQRGHIGPSILQQLNASRSFLPDAVVALLVYLRQLQLGFALLSLQSLVLRGRSFLQQILDRDARQRCPVLTRRVWPQVLRQQIGLNTLLLRRHEIH